MLTFLCAARPSVCVFPLWSKFRSSGTVENKFLVLGDTQILRGAVGKICNILQKGVKNRTRTLPEIIVSHAAFELRFPINNNYHLRTSLF